MAEGLSAVAAKALPRAIASGSWFGRRKPTAEASRHWKSVNPARQLHTTGRWTTAFTNNDLVFMLVFSEAPGSRMHCPVSERDTSSLLAYRYCSDHDETVVGYKSRAGLQSKADAK